MAWCPRFKGKFDHRTGGVLRLGCRVSLPPGGRITVQPGGRLILDGCRLHQACGKTWQGIFVQEKTGLRGSVELGKMPSLENLETGKK